MTRHGQADDKQRASDEAAKTAAEAKAARQAAQEAYQSKLNANEAAYNAVEEALKTKGVSSPAPLRALSLRLSYQEWCVPAFRLGRGLELMRNTS